MGGRETTDIALRLLDLYRQATVERSHYYTGKCIEDAMDEIKRLRDFVQFVADCTNDPRVRTEAIKMGAKP